MLWQKQQNAGKLSDKRDALQEISSFPHKLACDIWDSHCGNYEDFSLLGHDIV
jgi:hypothetical protein